VLLILTAVTLDFAFNEDKITESASDLSNKIHQHQGTVQGIEQQIRNQIASEPVFDDDNSTSDQPSEEVTPDEPASTITVVANFKSKNTESITVEATATSTNATETLTYELWTSQTEDGEYTSHGESEAVVQGTALELTADELESYTTYYWYVTAKTGKSETDSTKTYCPGTGLTCTTTASAGEQCSTCKGNKTVSSTCPGPTSSTSSCSNCGGYGTVSARYIFWKQGLL